MWNYIAANHATVTVTSSTEGIKKVLGGNYAFLIEYVDLTLVSRTTVVYPLQVNNERVQHNA